MKDQGYREIPQCPNTDDITRHPVYDEVPSSEEKYHIKADDGGWRTKAHWVIWTAAPAAALVDRVDAWGSVCAPDDPEEWETDEAIEMDYGVTLVLQTKDGQDVLQCSVCMANFTCSQDMQLTPLDSPADEGNTKWVVM